VELIVDANLAEAIMILVKDLEGFLEILFGISVLCTKISMEIQKVTPNNRRANIWKKRRVETNTLKPLTFEQLQR